MIDYTMDIRMRLNLGDEMPDELAARKQKVLATLIELQGEVEPITKATELLKDSDAVKDSKTFVAALTKGFEVHSLKRKSTIIKDVNLIIWTMIFSIFSFNLIGSIRPIAWANISMSAANTCSPFRICISAHW